MSDDLLMDFPATIDGFTVESHVEPRRVPRWPKINWLRWVKRDEYTVVIDKFHLTGVSIIGYPQVDEALNRRNFTVEPDARDREVGTLR